MNAIELNQVSVNVFDFSLKPMTFNIPKGHITGLIGRNGAGKTTFFKLLHGIFNTFQGSIKILGHNYKEDERMIRQHLGVMYDSLYLNPKFKPIKIVELEKEMHPTFNQTLFDQMVSDLNIDLVKPFKYQSLGMKRKFDVALSLSLGKDIIFLDEPFNGVDPVYKKIITQYIQKYMEDENHTVIISSHQVIDLEKIADYILILDQGEVLVFEEKETLLDGYKGLNHPFKKGTQEGLDNLGSNHIRATLEDVFIHLVGGDL